MGFGKVILIVIGVGSNNAVYLSDSIIPIDAPVEAPSKLEARHIQLATATSVDDCGQRIVYMSSAPVDTT